MPSMLHTQPSQTKLRPEHHLHSNGVPTDSTVISEANKRTTKTHFMDEDVQGMGPCVACVCAERQACNSEQANQERCKHLHAAPEVTGRTGTTGTMAAASRRCGSTGTR